MKKSKLLKTKYSVISRGTEKHNNHGYMGISEVANGFQYVLNIDHGVKKSELNDQVLKFKTGYTVENIAFSRFEIITALMYNKNINLEDRIIIYGLGNIGFTCLIYLLDKGYSNIGVVVKRKTEKIVKLQNEMFNFYNISINIYLYDEQMEEYNVYIDTTGLSEVLENIFEHIGFQKTVIILSTPREGKYLLDPLMINRKNLVIVGGHELNGINKKFREELFNLLLEKNKDKKFLSEYITIHPYDDEIISKIRNQKNNFIEILKYD